MILSLPDQIPYSVPGKNLLVQASLDLNNQEMGQDAFSDVSPRGSRPKKLSVALTLPYSQPEALQALLAIAEATTAAGDRVVYDIVDNTARAFGVRQVVFDDTLAAKERDTLQAWDVSFALLEQNSVAEQKALRLPVNQVDGITVDGQAVEGQGDTTFAKVLDAVQRGG